LYFPDSLAFSYLEDNADEGSVFFGDLQGQIAGLRDFSFFRLNYSVIFAGLKHKYVRTFTRRTSHARAKAKRF
jgi:hypothetical protein